LAKKQRNQLKVNDLSLSPREHPFYFRFQVETHGYHHKVSARPGSRNQAIGIMTTEPAFGAENIPNIQDPSNEFLHQWF